MAEPTSTARGPLDPVSIDQILIRRRIELRFRLDAAGRLVGENLPEDPDHRTAPRMYACLGADGLVFAFRHDVPAGRIEHATEALEAMADALFEDPERLADAAAAIAADWGGAPVTHAGPVYRIPRGLPQPADVILVDASNRDLLARHFPHTHAHLDALAPCAAHVIDGARGRDLSRGAALALRARGGRGHDRGVPRARLRRRRRRRMGGEGLAGRSRPLLRHGRVEPTRPSPSPTASG